MPTYDYICSECNNIFEEIRKIDDRNVPTESPCPSCGKTNCISLHLSAPSLVSPFRIDGLKKPSSQFKERMAQIKHGLRNTNHNLKKDY